MRHRVVVTGGSGRVGRSVVAELRDHYDVVNADRTKGDGEVAHEYVDVLDLDSVRRVTKDADSIIHLAAIDYDWRAPAEDYIRVNTLGTWHVLQAAVENDVKRVVLCSSVSACGLSEMRPDWMPVRLPVDEGHVCRPVDAYSVSKLMIEQMGRSIADGSHVNVVCLRPVAVVLPETLDDYLAFVDSPDRRWLFYYVTSQDVARGFRAALECGELRFGVFFLSADDSSLEQPTVDWYRERIGPLPDIGNPRRYRDQPRASVFSSAAARDVLGWSPTSNFSDLRRLAASQKGPT